MAKQKQSATKAVKAIDESASPRSVPLIANGDVRDSEHFAKVLSALMSDALMNAIPPAQGNVVCKAAGLMLKVTEMQLKYGPQGGGAMQLAGPK